MLRRSSLSRFIWVVAAGCGRLGFDDDTSALSVPASLQMETECGVAPPTYPLAIANRGPTTVRIVEVEAAGGFTITDALPIEIPPGEGRTLAVRPPDAVIGTDRGGDARTGSLTLLTSDGAYTVELAADVRGANVAITDVAGLPLTLTFSGPQCPAPITAYVVNAGNTVARLPGSAPFAFRVTGFASGGIYVGGGASATFSVRPYTSNACANSETLSFTVTGSVCTTTPLVLAASFNISGSTTCACT